MNLHNYLSDVFPIKTNPLQSMTARDCFLSASVFTEGEQMNFF
ncbi:hypothetical protein PRABACTJOHN_00217 [Parabacteroides johnsonii DSM 18315]|uniref:Uncharacterized protein n=1 Tax=Parabacteroides johnsonii DSM 18315 TaxID=537006 RepID=B7B5A9_9BACT|nr:hypothetical protein PRABACTJOHN_00217 [Parabacteroides johnsonii DSM 18315]